MEANERLEALEGLVRALAAELSVRRNATPTLKRDQTCPACSGRKVLHVDEVLGGSPSDPGGNMALAQPRVWTTRRIGEFEAFVCLGCGFTEFYVKSPRLVDVHELKHARVLDAAPPEGAGGPYR